MDVGGQTAVSLTKREKKCEDRRENQSERDENGEERIVSGRRSPVG